MIGGKTGYTEAAGYCFMTAARFDGREVVMAFLGAQGKSTRFADFNRVAEWLAKRRARLEVTLVETPVKRPKMKASGDVRGRVAKSK